MKGSLLLAATLFLCATLPTTALADSASSDQAEIDRGRSSSVFNSGRAASIP